MHAAASLSELIGLAAVTMVPGMRHGVDADQLAAIDAMTRCNAEARPALAQRTGLWLSAGHGGVVLAVALAVALMAHAWAAPDWLEPFGAWASYVEPGRADGRHRLVAGMLVTDGINGWWVARLLERPGAPRA
jgi:high-affinity nickel permease